MILTTVPRRIASLEYRAVRAPLGLIERGVMSRFLSDRAAVRLRFERALGTLDTTAGRLLHDDRLARRGAALTRRTDLLDVAERLDDTARARRIEARDTAASARTEAKRERAAARAAARDSVVTAEQQLDEDKQHARAEAVATVKEAAERADARRDARVRTAETTKRARQQQVETAQQKAASTAARKSSAAENRRDAAKAESADAERLAALAATEREQRRSTS